MSVVSLLNVSIKNNPAAFTDKYQFEITFEALEQLRSDLEFKLLYVGSATSTEYDQELDSLLVGPVPVGVNKFIFEADAPNLSRIPNSDILGVTVILLSCSYDEREFVRVGYYVNNEYTDEALQENPPAKPVIEKIRRSILAEKPRVTRFAIKWDSEESAPAEFPPDQPEADEVEDDEAAYGAEEAEEEVDENEAEGEAEPEVAAVDGQDAEMADTGEEAAQAKVEGENADEDSEDIGDESEEDDEEDDEAEEVPDEEMDTNNNKSAQPQGSENAEHETAALNQPAHADVMVH